MADTPITVAAGGSQTINQSGSYAVTFQGTGTLNVQGNGTVATINNISSANVTQTINVANGSTAIINGSLGGAVQTTIQVSGLLEFGSSYPGASSGPVVNFSAPTGVLKFDAGAGHGQLPLTVTNFGQGNSIDYNALADDFSYDPSTQSMTLTNGGVKVATVSIQPPNGTTYSSSNFAILPDGSGGTIIGFVCFLRGTRLATPDGQKRVEDLIVGDLVSTFSGEPAPIKWIGKRSFKKAGISRLAEAMPIRIRKGAIAPDVPHADLVVSPAHCLYLEGSLIPAQFLVNGCSIVQDFGFEEFEYFHVELDRHDIVIAENAATESYLDTGNRWFFANAGVVELFPDRVPKSWDKACAPFVTEGPALLAAKQKLLRRAQELGFRTVGDPVLRLRINGRDLAPIAVEGPVHTFQLPLRFSDAQITSRSSVAAHVIAAETDDRRRLGVAISRIVLRGSGIERHIPIDHPALSTGFYDCERQGTKLWRWTNGEARLPIDLIGVDHKPMVIELHVQGALPAYRVEAYAVSSEFQTAAA